MYALGIQIKNSREIKVAIWEFKKVHLGLEDLKKRKK